MSSGEDSETAEWEREQMLRGTQSRGQKYHQSSARKGSNLIDSEATKAQVNSDIEKIESTLESTKRKIGSARVEIVRLEKRVDALKKHIQQHESYATIFKELGTLQGHDEIFEFIEKQRHIFMKLPNDLEETLESWEKRLRDKQTPMDIDQ